MLKKLLGNHTLCAGVFSQATGSMAGVPNAKIRSGRKSWAKTISPRPRLLDLDVGGMVATLLKYATLKYRLGKFA